MNINACSVINKVLFNLKMIIKCCRSYFLTISIVGPNEKWKVSAVQLLRVRLRWCFKCPEFEIHLQVFLKTQSFIVLWNQCNDWTVQFKKRCGRDARRPFSHSSQRHLLLNPEGRRRDSAIITHGRAGFSGLRANIYIKIWIVATGERLHGSFPHRRCASAAQTKNSAFQVSEELRHDILYIKYLLLYWCQEKCG